MTNDAEQTDNDTSTVSSYEMSSKSKKHRGGIVVEYNDGDRCRALMSWMLGVLGVWMGWDEMRWVVVMNCTISLNVNVNVDWMRMNTTHVVRVEQKARFCANPQSQSRS